MVPGIFPSQLAILSTGQTLSKFKTYFETLILFFFYMRSELLAGVISLSVW